MYGELLCFLVVSMTESKSRKASAPLSERNVPEFFILILTFLIPLSQQLSRSLDNASERAIRPFTVHRKNSQSFGSEEGVQKICLFFTLCETCKNFSVNFKEYVAYAAKELFSGNTDYESLAPWAIKLV